MRHLKVFVVILCLLFASNSLQANDFNDTVPRKTKTHHQDTVKVKKHSPTTAVLLSIIPGGGQIYNHKYWKLPIVYGALAASSYFIYASAKNMKDFSNEFINRRDGNIELINPDYAIYNDENILQLKNNYQRNMEIAIGITAILYVLNMIDAMVDAHLYEFDISDDLSMRWAPTIMMPDMANHQTAFGLNLQFNLK